MSSFVSERKSANLRHFSNNRITEKSVNSQVREGVGVFCKVGKIMARFLITQGVDAIALKEGFAHYTG